MEYYNLRELRDNLSSRIQGLGTSSKFLDNPAYDVLLDTIQSLIRQMNLFDNEDSVVVGEEKGKIEFHFLSSSGDDSSMSISLDEPNTLQAIKVTNKKPYTNSNGQWIHSSDITEMISTISDSGFMTLTMNTAMLDNFDGVSRKYNNTTSSKKSIYNDKGVMVGVEYKGYPTEEIVGSIDDFSVDSALHVPRNAYGLCHDLYSTKTFLRREYFDTARMVHEDRDIDFYYNAVTRLNTEHGLRDMTMVGGYDPYPEKVEILPLSAEQIENLIQLEDNLKVQEGLREFVRDREYYSYDSSTDPSFVCTRRHDVNDIFMKALEERNDRLALSILKNKSFDRYFLNENTSLLYWSIYYGCDKVANTLLEDEKMVQLSEGENLFSAPNCQVLRGPNFLSFAISYTMILDRLLQTEKIDFSKISEACTYYILERQSQKNYVPFIPFEENLRPEHSKYILDFYTKVIENLLSKICFSDCEMPTTIDSDDKSLLYYITKYGTDVEFDMIMKSKLDINMQFEQDAKNNGVYYADDMMREWLLENPLTIALGCDDHLGYHTVNKEWMDFRRFSTLVFDKRIDSKYVLEAINRICYSEIPLKETLILKILASRDWPNEEIYDKTLLSFAFYGLDKAYRFLLSNPNVGIRTITLELIHEYARRFHKGEPGDVDCCDIKKSAKQEHDIEEVTMQLLTTRKDRISEKEMLPYDLIIFNFCCCWSEEFCNNLLEKFENSDLAFKIAMDSYFEISEAKTPLRISENFILYSYRIDHIDKFILQENEQNRELVSWAKNYTDRLIQEAGYLSSSSEKGKVKEKTVTTS